MKKKAVLKDFFREIKKNKGRFLSIFFIVMLGTAFFAGLRSTGYDMKYSADAFYKETKLMDIRVISTLGLTDADLETMRTVSGVVDVTGGHTADVICLHRGTELVIRLVGRTRGVNEPAVTEGRVPEGAGEVLLDAYRMQGRYEIGDTFTVAGSDGADLSDTLIRDSFTVVGFGYLPYYTDLTRGDSSIGDGSVDAFAVISPEVFAADHYTEAYVTVLNADETMSLSDEYKALIENVSDGLEVVSEEARARRYEEVVADANASIADARAAIEEGEQELADAAQALADGRQEIADAETEIAENEDKLADGRREYEEGRKEYEDGKKQVEEGRKALEDGESELASARAELASGKARYASGLAEYEAGKAVLEASQSKYDAGYAAYQAGLETVSSLESAVNEARTAYEADNTAYETDLAAYEADRTAYEERVAALRAASEAPDANQAEIAQTYYALMAEKTALETRKNALDLRYAALLPQSQTLTLLESQLAAAREQTEAAGEELAEAKAALDAGWAELEAGKAELDAAAEKIASGEAQIAAGQAEIDANRSRLEAAEKELQEGNKTLWDADDELWSGEQQLSEGKQQLADAKQELADGQAEYDEKLPGALADIEDGKAKIADAEEVLSSLEEPEWYILDRTLTEATVSYDQNAERMANLGQVFPVIFFLVAALVSLTAMTRMVDEQRMQIGTMKALGYGAATIAGRYFWYAMLATVTGGIIGIALGERFLPWLIIVSYGIAYPGLLRCLTPINWDQAILGLASACACTGLSTLAACYNQLRAQPAAIMRPVAPKGGRRVLLERIPFIWKHLSFNQKSTVRNLLRYKKRFFMTVVGVGGCMGLLLVGFGLHDSINEIAKRQYVHIFTYEASATYASSASEEERAALLETVRESDGVTGAMELSVTSVDLLHDKAIQSVSLFVADPEQIDDYLELRHRGSGERVSYPEEGAFISEKTADMLGVKIGDSLEIRREGERSVRVQVADIVENYVLHYLFISPRTYAQLYGKPVKNNTIYMNYGEKTPEEEADLGRRLMSMDACSGIGFVTDLEKSIDDMLSVLGAVVAVLIASAGLLAFVVLYNLNSINIMERRRELATLKVLGFYDGEVAIYVYRENIILTFFGIALGLLFGTVLHRFVIVTVEVDLMMFGRNVSTVSYVLSSLITLGFAVFVNGIMYFGLKKVDMIESLKSVE